jgi:adenylosuccinate synthase
MSKVHVVAGGQFGSEAKGAVAAFLSTEIEGLVIGVRVGGPNAGHTVYGVCPPNCKEHKFELQKAGVHPWRLRQVPVLAVSRGDAQLVIAAGSEVDIDVLLDEVEDLDAAGYAVSDRIHVDRNATVILADHKYQEKVGNLTDRLGSTAKGIGSARAERIMRTAPRVSDWTFNGSEADDLSAAHIPELWVTDTVEFLNAAMANPDMSVIIEGTQGYGLGLHTKYYPFVTSGDCRAIDFLAQAGISPWAPEVEVHVWLVVRPNPIRVAGNSGPLRGETSWADLELPDEHTTVTKKVRRVGEWDSGLVNDAIRANGGPSDRLHLVLTMVDHKVPKIAGARDAGTLSERGLDSEVRQFVDNLEATIHAKVELIGTGPKSMVWWRGGGPKAATVNPFDEVRRVIQSMFGSIDAPQFTGVDTRATEIVSAGDELTEWWLARAASEVKPMVGKALEYGGKGAAIDLIDIGTDLFRMMDRTLEEFTEADATELGIYFYLKGKFSRWTAALMEGRSVSDDTLLDIGVYVRMAQRTREVGGWPYGPEGNK